MRSAMSVTTRLPPLLPGTGTALGTAAGSRLRPAAPGAGAGVGRPGGGAVGDVGGAGRGGRDGYAVVVAVGVGVGLGHLVELRPSDRRGGVGLGDRGRRGGAAR